MPLPHFFIVGVPKAGTTALYNYLSQHPQIYLPPCKEPHYFSYSGESLPCWGIKTTSAYEKLFQTAVAHQIIGEASTWYLYSTTAANQIYQKLPRSKIIVLLRQPVERAYSSWAFRVQCGWEPIQDFEKAIEVETARIQSRCEWDFHYLSAGFYYPQLKRYFDHFPREQIRVYLQEDFKQDPIAVIRDVLDFLSVDGSYITDFSMNYNVTQLPKSRLVNQFLTKQNLTKSFLKAFIPNSLRCQLSAQLRTFNQTKVPPLSVELRRKLTTQYQEDIHKTEALTGCDLSSWQ